MTLETTPAQLPSDQIYPILLRVIQPQTVLKLQQVKFNLESFHNLLVYHAHRCLFIFKWRSYRQ